MSEIFLFFRNEQDTFSTSASDNNTRFSPTVTDAMTTKDETRVQYYILLLLLYYTLYTIITMVAIPRTRDGDAFVETCNSPPPFFRRPYKPHNADDPVKKKKTIIVRFELKWFFSPSFSISTSPRPTDPMTGPSIARHLAIRRCANNSSPKRDLTEIKKKKFFTGRVLSKRFLFKHYTKSFTHHSTHSRPHV